MQHLKPEPIRKEKKSDFALLRSAKIQVLGQEQHCVVNGYSIVGEAPKSFIRVYEGRLRTFAKIGSTNTIRKSGSIRFSKFYKSRSPHKV